MSISVSRVLQMPRGNVLMVGMGGSGRRSSCRLAAHIAECRLWTVQVTKTYTTQDWRDDLKKILLSAGFTLNHTVFLFSDSQDFSSKLSCKIRKSTKSHPSPFSSTNDLIFNYVKVVPAHTKLQFEICAQCIRSDDVGQKHVRISNIKAITFSLKL
uniref:Dynein heavy chain AAA module D4 domain-containing protein n=1 Tax=Glossina austeni TaxID=7395 RepID=A0A1A9VAL0_GLOAU